MQYAPFAGIWRGNLVEATSGSFGETVLNLQQSGGSLSGTWTAWFNSGSANGGTISGSVAGNAQSAEFQLTSTGLGQCPFVVTVALQTTQAQGTYASVNCPLLMTGTAHVYQDGAGGPTYAPALPGTPTGVVATAGAGQVTVRWTRVAQASSHNLYYGNGAGVTTATGTRLARVTEPATVTGLATGTPYYFIVTAENMSGEGAASSEVSATPTGTAPNPPSVVVASGGVAQATVSWSPVSGATGYNLYWSPAAGQAFSSGTRVTGASSPYTVGALTNGTAYFFAVTSTNAAGESAPSVEARATPYSTYLADFDDGTLQGWMPSGTWGVASGLSHSGSYFATDSPAGNYVNYADSSLTSQPIDLSGSTLPVLTFWQRYALESGYDYARVEISSNGGGTWTPLQVFNGFQSSWAPVTISLQGYAGQPSVLVRFRLTSDLSITYDGWSIDDIVISR